MNFERIYEYRFQGVDPTAKRAVWKEIASYLYRRMGRPEYVLEPGGGSCEFVGALPAKERWVVDRVDYAAKTRDPKIHFVCADVFDADLPREHFDAIFVSNFLEHLPDAQRIATFLAKMHACLRPNGQLVIVGPNFRYCAKEYFDCADHVLALTHVAVAEQVYASGFRLERVVGRFLPYSFRGWLPPSPLLTRIYLRVPLLWRFFGKQFLVWARKVPL